MPDSSPDKTVEADEVNGGKQVSDVKDSSAESSASEKSVEKTEPGEKSDMLSAVKAALAPKEKSPNSEEADSKKSDPDTSVAEKEGEDETGDDELTEEELSRLKPKTKKRIDTLLAERTERDRIIETLKPKAEQLDRLVDWVREADLSQQEVNQLFDIGKKLKQGDLRGAYEQMRPVYENLQQALGEVLPDELQQRVVRGEIDAATAKRLATAETERVVAQRNAERLTQRQTQDRARQESETHVRAVQTVITEWETGKSKSDPDWKLKQPLVTDAIELAIHRQGYPPTTAEAVKIADAALTEVNKRFTQLAPPKKEVRSVTDVASSRSTTAPKNMLDAVKAGLAKVRESG